MSQLSCCNDWECPNFLKFTHQRLELVWVHSLAFRACISGQTIALMREKVGSAEIELLCRLRILTSKLQFARSYSEE